MKTSTKIGICASLGILLFAGYVFHTLHTESELENAVYEWTNGKTYCGVCRKYEEIEYVRVGKLFDGDKRFMKIATKSHYDGKSRTYEPFDALAIVDGCHIRKMSIGTHPGCNYDCTGCDKWGWGNKNGKAN